MVAAGTLLWGASAEVGAQTANEYHVKAAFLFNFAKFVEWPAETFKGPAEAILICVLGESDIAGPLEEAVKGKLVGDRALVVQRGVVSGAGCHIVFAGSSGKRRRLMEGMKVSGVLTVGEDEAFLYEGGVVVLKLEADRVRVKINLAAAERAGLRISSKLLSLAQVVRK